MIIDLLKTRRSVRKFQDKPIPPAILHDILEAGRISPSGGNEQPWYFGVITDANLIGEIAGAAYKQKWIAAAPLLVVLCTRIVPDERGARDIQKNRYPEYAALIAQMDKGLYSALNEEEHQTKIAGAYMALAALEQGVGSTWVSYFQVAQVAKLLNLPKDIIPGEILVFGYPHQEGQMREKKCLQDLVFYNTFLNANVV